MFSYINWIVIIWYYLWMGNEHFGQFNADQIQKLYARFKQIDRDGSGELDPR